MHHLVELPLVGRTIDVRSKDTLEHWRCIFGGIWGPVALTEIGDSRISGSLRSRHIGELTFNQLTFGNQLFECLKGDSKYRDEPFYSLTFPKGGEAECFAGNAHMRLLPNHAYLIYVDHSAKLRVEKDYSTFNIQIPVSELEHRLGHRVHIAHRDVIQTDSILHMTQLMTRELINNAEQLDAKATRFLTKQMLDMVAFFLAGGYKSTSQDSLALKSLQARVLSYLDDNFHDSGLNPQNIAQACGVSRSYLYKAFSDGLSVMEHLKAKRLAAARDMIELRRHRLTFTMVAMACGFTNSSEFSRLFKKKFGVSPSEYRHQ